jgi:hypothetical protein
MNPETPIVIIATSLTKASDQIVRNGVRIARAAGARIHLVHAYDLTMLYSGAAMGGGVYLPELIEGESAGHLQRLQDQAWRLGIQREELAGLTALAGAPHRVLVETAAAAGASRRRGRRAGGGAGARGNEGVALCRRSAAARPGHVHSRDGAAHWK